MLIESNISMADAVQFHKDAGRHFFDKETMEFWWCTIETPLYNGDYFITSDRMFDNEIAYTIRQFDNDYEDVIDASGFGEFNTLDDAITALEEL